MTGVPSRRRYLAARDLQKMWGPLTLVSGQMLDKKWIVNPKSSAVVANGTTNAWLRRCLVHHDGPGGFECDGVEAFGAVGLRIEMTLIRRINAIAGYQGNGFLTNLVMDGGSGHVIRDVWCAEGSRGFLLAEGTTPATMDRIKMTNPHANDDVTPASHGQYMQVLGSQQGATITNYDFSIDPARGWTADGINVDGDGTSSLNIKFRFGVINGCNDPAGSCYEAEGTGTGNECKDTDMIHWTADAAGIEGGPPAVVLDNIQAGYTINPARAGQIPTTTSTTSKAIAASGSTTMTISPVNAAWFDYTGDSVVRFSDHNNPTVNWFEGVVTAHNPATGVMTILRDNTGGSGTFALWDVSLQPNSRGLPFFADPTTGHTLTNSKVAQLANGQTDTFAQPAASFGSPTIPLVASFNVRSGIKVMCPVDRGYYMRAG